MILFSSIGPVLSRLLKELVGIENLSPSSIMLSSRKTVTELIEFTAVVAIKTGAGRCDGHVAGVGSTVRELEAMDAADVLVLFVEVDGDGTLNGIELSGGVAVSARGINFPGDAVNGSGMRAAVMGVGIALQKTSNAQSDLGGQGADGNTDA